MTSPLSARVYGGTSTHASADLDHQPLFCAGQGCIQPTVAVCFGPTPFVVNYNDIEPGAPLRLVAGDRPAERGFDQAPLDLPVTVVPLGVELFMIEKMAGVDR